MLSVDDLSVEFDTPEGVLRAVRGVSFTLHEGEVIGVVGESGSGKSVTAQTLMGLLPSPPARIMSGGIELDGQSLLGLTKRQWRSIRGRRIAMVFQEPVATLDPLLRVGTQIVEAIRAHNPDMDSRGAWQRAEELLASVQVPNPHARVREYPHQFSGGMAQRVAIAMAIANDPGILIADEPTTALDVTVQAQVMRTLREVQQRMNAAMLLITHDLGLVADTADRVLVMYAGRVVESGPVHEIFANPRHPYTVGLLSSIPRLDTRLERLPAIRGEPPNMADPPPGCAFAPRCDVSRQRAKCVEVTPPLLEVSGQQRSACHFWDEVEVPVLQADGTRSSEPHQRAE